MKDLYDRTHPLCILSDLIAQDLFFIRNDILHYILSRNVLAFWITSFLEIYRLAATVYRMAVIKIIPPSPLKKKNTARIRNKTQHQEGAFLLAESHKPLYFV